MTETTEETEPVKRDVLNLDASDAELVAQRSADVDAETSDEHVKVFVIEPGPKPTEDNGYSHEANKAATVQYMISQGLRPTGDVHLVSIKPYGPGGKSWAITYAVPAVPAERFDFTELHVVEPGETVAAVKAAEKPKAKTAAKPRAKAPAKPKAKPAPKEKPVEAAPEVKADKQTA